MPEVVPLPSCGEIFLDARDEHRLLRASWQKDESVDAVVLSLWRDDDYVGEFRMAAEDVLEFVRVLVEGLVEAGPVRLGRVVPLTLATP
jgi:hypothetical protein